MASRPDRAFRIADKRHTLFDGTGAFLCGARWNSPGCRIVYAADTFAGAMLEMLVHSRIGSVPRTHAWIEIAIPENVSMEEFDVRAAPGWNAADFAAAREYGDEWCRSRRSLVLIVPSVVVASGMGRNVLFNQTHSEFRRLRSSEPRPVVWDERLFSA